ncbi:allergen [Kwoniella heveanensis BCC8398]|uniref:Allergen n=1 Tax=Kwoniella heveanensis BCC8398 TaxID=1296120 RepID=A0A1B9H318_9TREE|nr:allergen [Kwoniella heveanensis BCC8398]
MSGITQGVKEFLKGSHQADSTEVCSEVAPEVTKEHIRPTEHTETAEAIDRERHVHHHQHRIQPIEDKRTLETQHVHTTGPEVVREHKEEMLPEHQAKLHEQRTLHTNEQRTAETERTGAHLGQHVNEHEHHHIHETIQPVIQRETVQPTVVHHTAGIHEKIHEAPIVHEATTLPTITHSDFLKQKTDGGPMSHSDKGHQHQYYEGAPRVGGHNKDVV